MKFTPGPWTIEETTAMELPIRGPGDEVIGIVFLDEFAPEGECRANARLIESSPTMYGKLKETVAWLDREIAVWQLAVLNGAGPSTIRRLTELRDDLAETLRKIEEGKEHGS